jgi:hypothetical protein
MGFAQACGVHGAPREAACAQLMQRLAEAQVDQVRIGWCDLHGTLRGKTLMPAAVPGALRDGVGMVSTLLLKDTSDRTAFKVFEAATQGELPGYGYAGNLLLLPDPDSLVLLPWAPGTAWGEWGSDEFAELGLSVVPQGLAQLEGVWGAPMADYEIGILGNASVGYILSAVIGIAVVAGLVWLLSAALARRQTPAA